MTKNEIALIIGGFVIANYALIGKMLAISFKYYKEYLDLKEAVEALKLSDAKKQKDLDAAHKMIRDLKK